MDGVIQVQDPPSERLQPVIDLYAQRELQQALVGWRFSPTTHIYTFDYDAYAAVPAGIFSAFFDAIRCRWDSFRGLAQKFTGDFYSGLIVGYSFAKSSRRGNPSLKARFIQRS
jgi:hypothetical protein